VPGAPGIGPAVAGNASVTVSWTAPAGDGGSPITGHELQVLSGATVVRTVTGIAADATGATVTGLANGTGYTLRVRAVNAVGAGQLSAASNAVRPATVPGPRSSAAPSRAPRAAPAPRWPGGGPPASNGGPAVTGYRVTALRMSSPAKTATVRSRVTSPLLGPGARSRTFTLAAANDRFEVVAVNARGTGARSATSSNVVPR